MGVSPGRDAGARAAVGAAAMPAHEIKNPLSGIRGAAQLLEGGEGAADLTTLFVTEVDRIAALTHGMQVLRDTTPPELRIAERPEGNGRESRGSWRGTV